MGIERRDLVSVSLRNLAAIQRYQNTRLMCNDWLTRIP